MIRGPGQAIHGMCRQRFGGHVSYMCTSSGILFQSSYFLFPVTGLALAVVVAVTGRRLSSAIGYWSRLTAGAVATGTVTAIATAARAGIL